MPVFVKNELAEVIFDLVLATQSVILGSLEAVFKRILAIQGRILDRI